MKETGFGMQMASTGWENGVVENDAAWEGGVIDDGIEEESTPITSSLAGAAQATLGISESIWRTPEVANRFLDAVDQFGKRNLPDWMNNPVMANPLHYVEKGFDIGGQHYKGTSDLANDISRASESLNQFDAFDKISKKGQKADQALKTLIDTGDTSALGDVLTDADAWAGFMGQAAPSLYAAIKSGGSAAFISWLEGMEYANNAAEFEERTGQKIDPEEFVIGAAQVATINTVLEKFGLDKIINPTGGNILSSIVRGAVSEGGTEGLQNLNTNFAEQHTYNPDKDLLEGTVGSVMGGTGTGGTVSAGTHVAKKLADDTPIDEGNQPTPGLTFNPDETITMPDGSVMMASAINEAMEQANQEGNFEEAAYYKQVLDEAVNGMPEEKAPAQLEAPVMVGDSFGMMGTESQIDQTNKEKLDLGFTPDVQRASEQHETRQPIFDETKSEKSAEPEQQQEVVESPPVKTEKDIKKAASDEVVSISAIQKEIDNAAHKAAASPLNNLSEPTENQIESNNYKKGHPVVHGLKISIENPKDSVRRGTDDNGNTWENRIYQHYGDLTGTLGADNDPLDVFVGDNASDESLPVFVIDQIDPDTKEFDEHKIMFGYPTAEEAEQAYLKNYEKDWQGVGVVNKFEANAFKDWLKNGNTKKAVSYKKKPSQTDVFGKDENAQTIADEKVKKDADLNGTEDVQVDNGKTDDLFNQANKQTDIQDVKPVSKKEQVKADIEEKRKKKTKFKPLSAKAAKDYSLIRNESEIDEYNQLDELTGEPYGSSNIVALRNAYKMKDEDYSGLEENNKEKQLKEQEKVVVDTLNEANVTGKDRLEILTKFRSGDYSVQDVIDAYPAESKTEKETTKSEENSNKVVEKNVPHETKVKADSSLKPETENKENIEDFGEKIGGARKDIFEKTIDSFNKDLPEDYSKLTLSKFFPEPDYKLLRDAGLTAEQVSFIDVVRGQVPAKPRKKWKLKDWGNKLSIYRDLAQKLITDPKGGHIANTVLDYLTGRKTSESESIVKLANVLKPLMDQVKLNTEMGFPDSPSVKSYKLEKTTFSLFRGEKNVNKWVLTNNAKSSGFGGMGNQMHFDTREDAISALKTAQALGDTESKTRHVKFDMWSERRSPEKGIIVGKKVGSRKFIELKDGFKTAAEGRQYIIEHQSELEELLEKRKQIPKHRREVNNERVGEDYRNGVDVTPDQFGDTFGFRGVEFGNWVEQAKRQQDLNDAYDGLLDLASLLGIPPKAISLNGSLGLAFGARGHGARNGITPAAHYESGHVVINLTKKNGAGSLAHEWWHGLDNYFGKQLEEDGFTTERNRGGGRINNDAVRLKVRDAFDSVMKALDKTELAERSKKLDAKRSKNYWSTKIEMSARSFESYVISKLADNDASNDYLANISDETIFNMEAELFGGIDDSYPYIKSNELEDVVKAYDALFNELETKETDEGVALFSEKRDSLFTQAAELWRELAKNDLAFKQPKSESITINGIARKINSEIKVKQFRSAMAPADRRASWHLKMGDGRGGNIYELKDGTVFVDASLLAAGESMGSELYNIAAAYAHNNNLVFIGDPKGISEDAIIRRTENLISSTLKFGTTRHIKPHPDQNIEWEEGNDQANLENLLKAHYDNTITVYPEIQDVIYDFEQKQFISKTTGESVSEESFESAAADLRGKGETNQGRATLKRAAITNTFLQEESEGTREGTQRGRHGLLGQYVQQLRSKELDDPLKNTLYRKGRFNSGLSTSETRKILTDRFGKKIIESLEKQKILNIKELQSELPYSPDFPIGGMHLLDKAYLVLENLNESEVIGTFIHELGEHYGMEKMLGKTKYRQLMKQVELMARTNPVMRAARKAVPEDTNEKHINAETLAYFLEDSANQKSKLFENIMAAIKAFLFKLGIIKKLNTEDLKDLAIASIRSASRGENYNHSTQAATQFSKGFKGFKKWFGNSKVVDDNDEPLVVYHKTDKDFDSFDVNKFNGGDVKGIYFDENAKSPTAIIDDNGAKTIPVYLSIQNPASRADRDAIVEGLGGESANWTPEQVNEEMIKQGFDGYIDREVLPEYVAFYPEQIKSAIGNNGDYDSDNSNILFSKKRAPRNQKESKSFAEAFENQAKRIIEAAKDTKIADVIDFSRTSLLPGLTRRQIVDLYSRMLPGLTGYNVAMEKLGADRATMADKAANTTEKWIKWTRSTSGKAKSKAGKTAADRLANLMHQSTIYETDPSKGSKFVPKVEDVQKSEAWIRRQKNKMLSRPGESHADLIRKIEGLQDKIEFDQERRNNFFAISDLWKSLDKEAQDLYIEIRDSYSEQMEEMQKAIEDRIQKANVSSGSKRETMLKLRQDFEKIKQNGPYFPLSRHGDFWISAEKKGGEKLFEILESRGQWRLRRRELEKQGYGVNAGVKLEKMFDESGGANLGMVTDLNEILEGIPSAKQDILKDAMYQIYLRYLPDSSIRKHFIHRKKTEGYSRDALRSFANSMFHGAHQISRLKYSHILQANLDKMEEAITGKDKDGEPVDYRVPTESQKTAKTVYEEMNKRHQKSMNPESSWLANTLTQAGFVMFLGITPGAAIVNLTQTAMVSYPMMGAKWGFRKSSAALTEASKDFIVGKSDPSSKFSLGNIANSKRVKNEYGGDTKRAIERAIRESVIDLTLSHDLAAIGESHTEKYNPTTHKVMKVVSWSFHNAERYNRMVTFTASYRLARKAGSGHEAAFNDAANLVWDSHFDYSYDNKPRLLQNDIGKVIGMFKQFVQNMTYVLVRTTQKSLVGESQAVKDEARKTLLGILVMQQIFGGVLGMPVMTDFVFMIMEAFNDNDDEPYDAELDFRNWANDTLGEKWARTLSKGVFNGLAGIDTHSRISYSGMWYQGSYRELEGRADYTEFVMNILGPMNQQGKNMAQAVALFSEGEYQRGFEKMVPKFARDLSRAKRYTDEGVTNRRGDILVSPGELSEFELFSQAIGLTPSLISDRYDANRLITGKVDRLKRRKKKLKNRYLLALRNGDDDSMDETMELILDYNDKNPNDAIRGSALEKAIQGRNRRSSETINGLWLDKRHRHMLDEARFAD